MVKSEIRWTLRDWLAVCGLFAATAGVILWQNAHLTVLWDCSYVLDSATRIAEGQMPYRDFPLAHAPLTFLIQAAIIRLTGRVFWHHALYAAVAGGLGTVLTWRIILRALAGRMNAAWAVALGLATPLAALGIYCIYPLPSYDCDCALAMLAGVLLLQRLAPANTFHAVVRSFVTGAALCLPLFFKQNIGLPFLAAAVAVLLLPLAAGFFQKNELPNPWARVVLATLGGVATTLAVALATISATAGLGNYLHWTIEFAAQRRMPGLGEMVGVYRDPQLLWTLPCVIAGLVLLRVSAGRKRWAQWTALVLMAAPFLVALSSLLIYDDADERGDSLLAIWPLLLILAAALAVREILRYRRYADLEPFLPIVLLVAIHGTLMSQQLWGSTYALWPLLTILIAGMMAYLARRSRIAPGLAFLVAGTLIVCGAFYTASEDRLAYVNLPEGKVEHSALPALKGMAAAGPYLPEFDELLRFAAARIPQTDGVILLPGEDPFYFATGRAPQFPVTLFDPATDPYLPEQVVEQARKHSIRWLVVKRDLQLNADPMPQREQTINALLQDFVLNARLRGYDVYQRR
jgi:hypothetical protein